MKRIATFLAAAFLCGTGTGRADFKYSETGKITGGMMAGMMKFAGAFSKKANEPIVSTYYLRGNRLRTEHSTGKVEIIDLDGRRFINLDTQKQTYSVITFDEMRAALQKLQESGNAKGANVIPKVEVTPTSNTKVILGQPTREVKVRIEMQVQAQNPQQQDGGQTASMTVTSDMWIAPSVRGFDEVRKFHERMAKELNWMPGTMFGGNPQMAKGMAELQKGAAALNGLPLLQFVSMGMAGMPASTVAGAGASGTAGNAAKSSGTSTQEVAPSKSATPEVQSTKVSSPKDVVTKGLGGVFSGFGRKKKKQEQPAPETEQATASSSAAQPASAEAPPANASGGSLMDLTEEVTSFANDALDNSLFEVPAGYRQVQESADKMLGGNRR